MRFNKNDIVYVVATSLSLGVTALLWLSLDRRFLEKYYLKWTIADFRAVELVLLVAAAIFSHLFVRRLIPAGAPSQRSPADLDRLGWSLLIGNMAILCAATALIMFGRTYLGLHVKELGHIALAQEALILLGLLALIAAASQLRRSGLRTLFGIRAVWLCGLLCVAVFLLLMEEISWGQHIVGWTTPDTFQNNIQNETNIHNF